jgi:hypothetical protein
MLILLPLSVHGFSSFAGLFGSQGLCLTVWTWSCKLALVSRDLYLISIIFKPHMLLLLPISRAPVSFSRFDSRTLRD